MTNAVEGWHNKIKTLVGNPYLKFITLIECSKKEAEHKNIMHLRLEINLEGRKRRKQYLTLDDRIEKTVTKSHDRTPEDMETIYEELLHIKALSHLSISVKRELAAVIVFEAHTHPGAILFNQGDEGRSWYIILRGSVDVVIHGKGTVTTLQEGDDFGKLALINDAPRAATIVLREVCHFLRVDKDNFNSILRDVEANTVRLKEHGQDVLVLEKISHSHSVSYSHFKYTVMAGTPQKMVEHLLETRLDGRGGGGVGGNMLPSDPFLEDFLLTHIVFMPTNQLVAELARQYPLSILTAASFTPSPKYKDHLSWPPHLLKIKI
uniref:Cyclic nucleotide-binding domain-containing protein n=1 Tax=Timema monikensis TaxID=170555 RepID=A0A7R9ELX9_9NEOP|nr:unnamed protein product [Timema monikensis]